MLCVNSKDVLYLLNLWFHVSSAVNVHTTIILAMVSIMMKMKKSQIRRTLRYGYIWPNYLPFIILNHPRKYWRCSTQNLGLGAQGRSKWAFKSALLRTFRFGYKSTYNTLMMFLMAHIKHRAVPRTVCPQFRFFRSEEIPKMRTLRYGSIWPKYLPIIILSHPQR